MKKPSHTLLLQMLENSPAGSPERQQAVTALMNGARQAAPKAEAKFNHAQPAPNFQIKS